MYSIEEHLDNLIRHINLVRDNCVLLGKRLIKNGRQEFGLALISRGFQHDVSKFHGIEWDYLHVGPEAPEEKWPLAVSQHVRTNSHHPEYWGGIQMMPELEVAEMVCDWYARSQEFGTGLRAWIDNNAVEKFSIDKRWRQWEWICSFIDILLVNHFVKSEEESGDENANKE